jgi:hypothetical protein
VALAGDLSTARVGSLHIHLCMGERGEIEKRGYEFVDSWVGEREKGAPTVGRPLVSGEWKHTRD